MASGIRSASDPRGGKAVATGTLAGIPLAHALVYIRNKRLSGVLELKASAQKHAWAVIWRGSVVSIMTQPAVARFGTVVYELGMIDAEILEATTVQSMHAQRPQMDILLERGLLTPRQRDRVLEEQATRRVHHLFTFPPTTVFTFREGAPSGAIPGVLVDLLAPVWRGLRDFPPDARASEVIARIGHHPLRLVDEAVLEAAELSPDETALCETLAKGPLTVENLKRTSRLPRSRVELLSYFLVITRSAEVLGAEHAPLPSGAMWTATRPSPLGTSAEVPKDTTPEHASGARLTAASVIVAPTEVGVEGIRKRAAGLATETPFGALGLPEGASSEAARAAYFRLSRVWNPTRIPAELDVVRSDVERIFAHMTEAHRVLTDPHARPALLGRSSS